VYSVALFLHWIPISIKNFVFCNNHFWSELIGTHLHSIEETRQMISDAGGIKCIIAAMSQHKSVADVQESGCGSLLNLSASGNNSTRSKHDVTDHSNRFQQRKDSFRRWHSSGDHCNERTQESTWNTTECVWNSLEFGSFRSPIICLRSSHCCAESNRMIITSENGIESIIDAMSTHKDNLIVQGIETDVFTH
jgi:hypothetical protein